MKKLKNLEIRELNWKIFLIVYYVVSLVLCLFILVFFVWFIKDGFFFKFEKWYVFDFRNILG